MNHVPNFKIEQLNQKLADTDLAITKYAIDMHDQQVRASIDTRRHLLASLKRELLAEADAHNHHNAPIYAPMPEIEQFIDAWCNRVTSEKSVEVSYQSPEFCHLFLDHTLPKSWNFDEDIIIIHQPQSQHLLEALQSRNQKHIIIYNVESPLADDVRIFAAQKKIPIVTSIENLERNISLLQIRAEQVISISCENNTSNAQKVRLAITDAVNAGKRTRVENTATVSKFGKSWAINILKNLPQLQNAKNLHQLEISGVKDAVVVASGPSLCKNVNQLKEIQDKVFVITALRSLPVLNAAGVEPDLVIQLDAEDDEVAQKLSPDPKHPIKNLLVEGMVNPGFLSMPATNIIWSLPQHFFDIHQEFGTKPTPFNVPSVSIYGLCLSQFLKFKNICFIGQDLAASGGKQYADGATNLLPAHSNISMFQLEVPGFYGDTVMTRNSYEYQIKRCSEIAREWRSQRINVNLVNATEGGAFIEGFEHMTLDTFIQNRQLREKEIEKYIKFSPEFPITAENLAPYTRKIHGTMGSISALADMIIKLDQKAEKNRGLDKKIKKVVNKFQLLNNSTSLLQIAMQQSIANVIGTSRGTNTVDSYAQFFSKVKDHADVLKSVAKSY
ncbi:DUF115 domain-containing protein [Alphaproteobacteria bacterium]|nr:DUF115 domain-containing protein [Alphaproteobacteria bacterium]